MSKVISIISKTPFDEHDIPVQLDRIFLEPVFSRSGVLKNFLSFIVQETLSGHANCLKEYTIAVNVLKKPVSFNPQNDCIVRIHACRLRNALSQYYHNTGLNDRLIIHIPKGKYVPVFMDCEEWQNENKINKTGVESGNRINILEEPIYAILPFTCAIENGSVKSFSEDLCLQICSGISQLKSIAVIAYQAVKPLLAIGWELRELASIVGCNHIITGGVQCLKDNIRINVQIIDCNTYRQLWSKIYEGNFISDDPFIMQDEICKYIIEQVKVLNERLVPAAKLCGK